uniref:ABC transporter domain-containing protein n=1 Tax=Amphimedon queenslandica TaxID=400682 RepID=A0A1X7T546_AMPQE
MSGYVVQDDVIMGTLSVHENLYFSAALRLPNSMKWAKKRRLEKVIGELGLSGCADTKKTCFSSKYSCIVYTRAMSGTEFICGVSGGERKRTNIGMELIIEPQVLFLDEPTTGLDAFTAVAVVQLLRK